MIKDLVIIKDGVPLLAKNLSNSQKGIFTKDNDLIMLSGFFSALNSFSDQFEELGSIKELKLSKNNLKLSFLNDTNVQNLVYLATFDNTSNSGDVRSFLKNVSKGFVNRFGIDQIKKWAGRREMFETFEDVIDNFLENDEDAGEEIQIYNPPKELSNSKNLENVPDYFNYVPQFKTSKNINPEHYLTGETSCIVFNKINGKKSISQIAEELKMDEERVYAISKNLIKFGFISLS
ncbi:MAG: hypothetical protein ACFFHV_08150 [Promethearchaeota archaeon]